MDAAKVAAHWEANADTWTRYSRAGYDVYRDALNTPAFLAMLPPVDGLDGLDVGCGEGTNTRKLALLGARMHAVDIAPTFIRHARETEVADPLGIDFRVDDGTALRFPDGSFDFVTAFMSLMDMADQGRALCAARAPAGRLPAILDPASLLCSAAPESIARARRQDAGRRGCRLFRGDRRPRRNLVVLDIAQRRTSRGCPIPCPALSPNAEFMGRDDLSRRAGHSAVW